MRFTVRKMPVDQADLGTALLSEADILALGLKEGDAVIIKGTRKCAARIKAWGLPPGEVAIDGVTRKNAGTGIGEFVEVEPRQSVEASLVTLGLPGPLPKKVHDVLKPEVLRERLCGRVVGQGDFVGVRVFSSRVLLEVIGSAPQGLVTIGAATELTLVQTEPEEKAVRFVSYEDIGGLDAEIEKIREMVEFPVRHPELFDKLGIEPPRGLLLWGPPGTGKTLVAKALASQIHATFIHIDGPEVAHKYYGETERQLREIFAEARRNAPAIIFIDELDAIAPKRSMVQGDVEKRAVGQLLALMDGMNSETRVVVIGATNMPELLDPALRRPGRFDREIYIGPPDAVGRHEILKVHTRNMPLSDDVDLSLLASLTAGFVGADLENLCREAALAAMRRARSAGAGDRVTVEMADFLASLGSVEPTASRGLRFERSNTRLRDLAGMEEVKRKLMFAARGLFSGDRRVRARAILVHGPAGNGKSALVRACAGELGVKFLELTPASVLGPAPERSLEEAFAACRRNVPCILFLNRLDATLSGRQGSRALHAQLEWEIEEASALPGLLVIATSSSGKEIPGLPPGTFDVEIEVPPPDFHTRLAIINRYLGGDAELEAVGRELAAKTEGMTSGEVIARCKTVLFEMALSQETRQDRDSKEEGGS